MKTAPTFDQIRAQDGLIHIHGHRGARGIIPENTLESFRFTFDVDVRVIELDVLMTADDIPVLTHNPSLLSDMTRDHHGQWLSHEPLVRELSLAELQSYDVGGLKPGSEYAARFPEQAFIHGMRIPTLEALCELVNQPEYADVFLNLEIKSNPHHPQATPEPAAYTKKVLEIINKYRMQERTMLQSFDWRVVHESARQAPAIPRSYLCYSSKPGRDPHEVNVSDNSPWMDGYSLADYDNSLPRLVAAAGGQIWAPYHKDLTAQAVAEARECGLMVNVWTVNELADIDRMIELGVDGIITDYPGRVQRRFMDHGLRWK
ncbi:glycerophosphodiester phosphodiesterase [Leucothrix pacifica]|uniref:Glycerophosphodiester phosphodiesterase n=1 Tax=Leucothrix pacifica TaxID=1247513 RepID=A0A317C293_9GAMM|nr:glycerophosphodiester phosphodiesterase [Leucothrix pacifica]PWQ92469.1 glycerophosphodiester phosphodiesterase [Leucothrix pacifica]